MVTASASASCWLWAHGMLRSSDRSSAYYELITHITSQLLCRRRRRACLFGSFDRCALRKATAMK